MTSQLAAFNMNFSCNFLVLTEHLRLPGHTCRFISHDVAGAASSAAGHALPRSTITAIATEDVPRFGAGLDGAFVPPRAAGIIHGFYHLNGMVVCVGICWNKECIDDRSPPLVDKYFFVCSTRMGSHLCETGAHSTVIRFHC